MKSTPEKLCDDTELSRSKRDFDRVVMSEGLYSVDAPVLALTDEGSLN